MGTTVTPVTGNAVWPAVEEAAGAESFLGVLGEVAGGVPGAIAGIARPTAPSGNPQRGEVVDHPDLTFAYHPDELAVSIGRTGLNGTTQPITSLMRDSTEALHDASGSRAGQILPDGTVSLDPAWMQEKGLVAASSEPPVSGATPGRKTKGPTTQWEKPGGLDEADRDFDAKQPKNVKPLPGGGRAGELPDGRKINVRPESSSRGRPTLEIQDGRKRVKVRYGS